MDKWGRWDRPDRCHRSEVTKKRGLRRGVMGESIVGGLINRERSPEKQYIKYNGSIGQ